MNFIKKVNHKVVSIALATAMAFGLALAPAPTLLDGGQSVVEATQGEVTELPDPDKTGNLGTGANIDLGLDTGLTTVSNGQTITSQGIVLLGFNKNVTTKNNKNPLPNDAIFYNSDKVTVVDSNGNNTGIEPEKVPNGLIDDKNDTLPPGVDPYDQQSYRNYIYLNTHDLPSGQYTIRVHFDLISANATLDSNDEPIYTDSKSCLVEDTAKDFYTTITFTKQ